MTTHSRWRLFVFVATHEWRVLLADRSLIAAGVLLLGLTGYALLSGAAATAERDRTAQDIAAREQQTETANRALLRDVVAGRVVPDPFANPADPASIGSGMGARYTVLPSAPLAAIATGQSDLYASYYRVSYRSKATFMYDSEIENPWNLLSGHFDYAFVIVYLLPLIVFATSYNLLSAEREQGTLRMLLAQPLTLGILVAGKVAVRAAALLSVAAVGPALLVLALRPDARAGEQWPWLVVLVALVAAYGVFWFALAAVVNSLGRSSAANALALVGLWVVLVLVAPVLLNLVVARLAPMPSRTELATQTRLITIHGLNEYSELLGTDYRYVNSPEVVLPKDGKIDVAPRLRGLYLVQRDTDRALETMLDAFAAQLARQQALVDRFGVVSPAVTAFEALAAVAGNGSRRYLRFERQVSAYHDTWKQYFEPRVLDGTAIADADFDRMPRFAWAEEAGPLARAEVWGSVRQLTAVALLLSLAGAWRLRRLAIV